jgi:hypothetical protein
MYGESVIEKFHKENAWVHTCLPQSAFDEPRLTDPQFFFKRIFENLSRLLPMNSINLWLFNFSKARWKRKYSEGWGRDDFEIAFRSKEGISKSHPRFFQKRALDLLENKIKAFEFQHGIDLMI